MTNGHALTAGSGSYHAIGKNKLAVAIAFATLVHVLIFWDFTFSTPQPVEPKKLIDVGLIYPTTTPKPNTSQPASPDLPPIAQQPANTAPSDPLNKPKPPKDTLPANNGMTAPKKPVPVKSMTQPKTNEVASIPQPTATSGADRPSLSADALQQQIAQLGERMSSNQFAEPNAKIKFVSAVREHKFLASQYLRDWDNKVERTGNMNYPEAARRNKEAQTLSMDVGINADGSIYSIRIVRSSGNRVLDESAVRIVKMSAPFAELPYDLRKEVDVLVITRTWKFSDESGMTSH